jgi:beta-lactamase regulating signal transducer with metallopeptidase domain
MLLGMARLLLPFEFHFTKTINIENIWPDIYLFFDKPRFSISVFQFSPNHILIAIWIIGSLACLIKLIISHLCFSLSARNYPAICEEKPNAILRQIASQYKKPVNFHLCYSATLNSPSLFGIFRPRIIVPMTTMSDKEWHYIISHEVAHYYNKDLAIKLLVEIFIAIYWWNPLLYLMKRRLNNMIEINVDIGITKNWEEGQRLEYLEFLALLPQRKNLARADYLATFENGNKSALTQRIQLMLDSLSAYQKPNIGVKIVLRLIPIIALAMPLMIIFEPYSISPEHEEGTFELTSESSYYIKNDDGTYSLYLNDEYVLTQPEATELHIKIYENIKEASK